MAEDDIGTLLDHCINDRVDYALFFLEAGLYDIKEIVEGHDKCMNGCITNCTALHLSVMRGQQMIVEKLLTIPELEVDHLNYKGLTALHIAIKNNKPEIAKMLIMNGASTSIKIKNTNNDDDNSSPLLLACYKPPNDVWIEVIKLLADKDIELEQKNYYGFSPLYACLGHAIDSSNFEVFDYLLEKGFKADIIFNKSGLNCLDYAEDNDCEYIIEKLNAIPDYDRNYLSLILKHLDYAFFNNPTTEKNDISYEKIKNILEKNTINLNVDINRITSKWNINDTVLHYVCYKGDLRLIKLFINHGSDINAQNNIGITPIIYTLYCNNDEVIDYMINLENIDLDVKLIEEYRSQLNGIDIVKI
jgi:ankyrin repeat protein